MYNRHVMTKEIVWVMGSSATGKETFIRSMTSDAQLDIKAPLGWSNKRVLACLDSIYAVGQFKGDPITEKRAGILHTVPALLPSADVILIKWQFVDSDANRLLDLKDLLPDARHRLVVLRSSIDTLKMRLPMKSWWNKGADPIEFAKDEQRRLNEKTSELRDPHGFHITYINSTNENYYIL